MLTRLLRFLPTEEIIRIVPGIIVDLLSDLLDKKVDQETQDLALKYLKIADYANEALDVIIEILNCIIEGKEVDPAMVQRLERWAKGLPKQ